MFFKLLFPFIWLIFLDNSIKSGMEKVYYYSIMTNIPIFKSLSDIYNKELLPVSGSSSRKNGVHNKVKTKRKSQWILMIQRLVIKIYWKVWVIQCEIIGRKGNYTSTIILHLLDGCYVVFTTFTNMQVINKYLS